DRDREHERPRQIRCRDAEVDSDAGGECHVRLDEQHGRRQAQRKSNRRSSYCHDQPLLRRLARRANRRGESRACDRPPRSSTRGRWYPFPALAIMPPGARRWNDGRWKTREDRVEAYVYNARIGEAVLITSWSPAGPYPSRLPGGRRPQAGIAEGVWGVV